MFRGERVLQRGQHAPDALHVVGISPADIIVFVKSTQSFVSEPHASIVPRTVSRYKPGKQREGDSEIYWSAL